ncbi:DNA cytosine methyltransferase [Nocardia sp. NPDC127579]|uniref:DNA cytosine methyltransferase n=1 Tax=Nocardia sp. NPDC127579 TaxID=3345402 RepID=UPI00363BD461
MTLSVTDLFCGAGGSTTGLTQVPGYEVVVASNLWQLALDTHGANHPDVDHKRADIHTVDPRTFPTTDVLWASPECTNHSKAKGRKKFTDQQPDLFGEILPDEAAERSRATMWDVVRFTEFHGYQAVLVENVVDVADWACWSAWLLAMHSLGYEHRCVFVNSMHAQAGGDPAPQSRDRIYVVFWRKGNRAPDLNRWMRPRAYCGSCEEWVTALQGWKNPRKQIGVYRAQYQWRCPRVTCRNAIVEPGWLPAASAIDWSLPGYRIGDRKRPLAANTMARIEAGIRKFYGEQPCAVPQNNRAHIPGLLVPAGGTRRDKATSLLTPMPTRTTTENDGLLVPVEGRDGKTARSLAEVMRTQTARNETGLLMPYYTHGGSAPASAPHRTLTAVDRYALVVPLRNHNTAKPVIEPLDTFAAAGNHHSLLTAAKVPADVRDWLFRMLEPHEIAAGMAFPDTYRILGNKRERVRQAGNAVTPPAARDLGYAVAESLGVTA